MRPKAPRTFRRRQWIVNRPLQYRFVGLLLIFFGLLTFVTLLAMGVAIWTTLYTFNLLRDPVIISLYTTTAWILAFELVLMSPVVIWLGIRLSHTVAGPLVRIDAALAKMARGDFDVRISLRKGDALIELAEAVNRLAESLRGRAS